MRVAFLGNDRWSVPTLDAVHASAHDVVLVVTAPQRPAGRGRHETPTAVAQRARELGLPLDETGGTLVPVLAVLVATLGAGYAARARCADGVASDLAYSLCYTDMVPLYRGEGLDRGRLPYIDPCPGEQSLCDEYPVVQMWLLRAAGALSDAKVCVVVA